jgi:hypothetical protein
MRDRTRRTALIFYRVAKCFRSALQRKAHSWSKYVLDRMDRSVAYSGFLLGHPHKNQDAILVSTVECGLAAWAI